jgi:DNA-binding MarR family transcriptional regulator
MSRRIASANKETLNATETEIQAKLGDKVLDFDAMSAVSNIYRAGSAVRNHMERDVLDEVGLSWVAFTVLWVLWIWGEQETAHVAEEAGVTKGTLTGVIKTLQSRKFVKRVQHRDDRRRVSISLTKSGNALIERLFPVFNTHEQLAVKSLTVTEQRELARLLRKVIGQISSDIEH